MANPISRKEFLDKKRDYSPLLVHLTRDGIDETGNPVDAEVILDSILDEKTLRAFNYNYCIFGKSLKSRNSYLQDKFKVVCFTETPIDQIDVLTQPLQGRMR